MVATAVLETAALGRVGSTPTLRTKYKENNVPFVKGQSGNPLGRIPKSDANKYTRKEKKAKELEGLLRKLAPHVSKSIATAAAIMQKTKDVKDADKLKASTIILDFYKSTILEIAKIEEEQGSTDEEGQESEQESAPVFSLVMPKEW